MTDDPIYIERAGEIASMVIDRPAKKNALNREAWRAIAEFSQIYATVESAREYHEETLRGAYEALAGLAKPTSAVIRGICYGGGCALALACDLRSADTTARFSIPPAKLGLASSLRETRRVVDVIGPSRAKEMLFSGRVVAAREAVETGLVTRVFPPAALERETVRFAKELCRLSQYSIRAVKQVVQAVMDGARDETTPTRQLVLGAFAALTTARAATLSSRSDHRASPIARRHHSGRPAPPASRRTAARHPEALVESISCAPVLAVLAAPGTAGRPRRPRRPAGAPAPRTVGQ